MKRDRLDELFSEYIRKRAGGACQRCLTEKYDIVKDNGLVFPAWKQLQCSHFFGRAKLSVRFDPDNASGICGACHLYFTANPLEHYEWFKEYLGEKKFEDLRIRARIKQKPDKNAISLWLKKEIEELTEDNAWR